MKHHTSVSFDGDCRNRSGRAEAGTADGNESRGRACILPLSSYADPRLREAVSRLLKWDRKLTEWLAEGGSERRVVVKPNWIQDSHQSKADVWESVITHPALLLAIIEVLAELMTGEGTICVCDAPNTYADFKKIAERGGFAAGVEALKRVFPRMRLEIVDLRREVWVLKENVVVDRRSNRPDPQGYVSMNLGCDSLFFGHAGEGRYYGADYDSYVVNDHHHGRVHEYLLAGTPMRCDLFINVPKLKTHRKTGMTCCLKNLVGINGDKNWLPHHTSGIPRTGGDEFSEDRLKWRLESWLKRAVQRWALAFPRTGTLLYRKARKIGIQVMGDSGRKVRSGNWAGNDTCWRMALDLNRALLYGNPDGTCREFPQAKRYLAIVDGITGGEGDGPLSPDPVASGVLIAGTNPAVVDAVACTLMGFAPIAVPIVREAFAAHRWPISDVPLNAVIVEDGRCGKTVAISEVAPAVEGGFKPHFAWNELNPSRTGPAA